jgi:hypothetical protein
VSRRVRKQRQHDTVENFPQSPSSRLERCTQSARQQNPGRFNDLSRFGRVIATGAQADFLSCPDYLLRSGIGLSVDILGQFALERLSLGDDDG